MMIRPMETSDVAQVSAIEQETFGDPWSEMAFYDSLRQQEAAFLVAEEASLGIVGYCGAYRALDEAEIVNVAVRRDCRNRGVGRELVEHLLQLEKDEGVHCLILEVRESNRAARHVYESLGFKAVGVRKHFYEQPAEDAVIMQLEDITADE